MANWAVRVTGIYSRNFNQYRLLETAAAARGLQHSDHESGSRARRSGRHGRRSGHVRDLLRLSRQLARSRVRGHDAGQRSQGGSDVQDHRSGGHQAALPRAGSSWRPTRPRRAHVPFTRPRRRAIPYNPNAEINAANNTWEWTGKFSGAYTFPLGIIASANFEHRSGDAAGAAGALYRRPRHSVDRGERRADWAAFACLTPTC